MDYNQAIDYLMDIGFMNIKFGLDNTLKLLEHLGNPHKDLKIIHIAGTNGKGSTAAMLSSILKQKYKVGLYTSPHLVKLNERIRINDVDISDKDLIRLVEIVREKRENQTYFETIFVMAVLFFKQQNCDYVILEVGMGGRLDSTNVVTPLVSVITNVSFDHIGSLGNTIRKIAFEKAGIIKPKVPVVTAVKGCALDVIKEVCEKQDSTLSIVNSDDFEDFSTNLEGDFQNENMSCAITSLRLLNLVNEEEIKKGLMNVRWPGRMERIGDVILDGAHNLAAFDVLIHEIKKENFNKLIVVFGLCADKNCEDILSKIYSLADIFIVTKSDITKALNPKEIAHKLEECQIIDNPKKAFNYAKKIASENDLILVCGSIYLVGNIKRDVEF